MVLTVVTPNGALVFSPGLDANKRITWGCEGGDGTKASSVPQTCRPLRRSSD